MKKFLFNADDFSALVERTKELQEAHKQEEGGSAAQKIAQPHMCTTLAE